MDQIDERSRLARELSRLRASLDASLSGPYAKDAGTPISLQLNKNEPDPPADVQARSTGQLSDRELDVLRAIAAGLANKDIATPLHISVATTRNHVQHILKKLNVHSKLEAITLAFRNGWA